MQCEEAQALIDLRVDGSLTALRADALDKHLQGCLACSRDLAELLQVRSMLSSTQGDRPAAGTLERLWPALALAASAAAADSTSADAADSAGVPAGREPVVGQAVNLTAATAAEAAAVRDGAALSGRKQGSMGMSTSTVNAGGVVGSRSATSSRVSGPAAAARMHPRWRKPALLSMLMVAMLVVCYAVGTGGRLSPERGANAPLSGPPDRLAMNESMGTRRVAAAAPGAGATPTVPSDPAYHSMAQFQSTKPADHEKSLLEIQVDQLAEQREVQNPVSEVYAKRADPTGDQPVRIAEELRQKMALKVGVAAGKDAEAARANTGSNEAKLQNLTVGDIQKIMQEEQKQRDYDEGKKRAAPPAAAPASPNAPGIQYDGVAKELETGANDFKKYNAAPDAPPPPAAPVQGATSGDWDHFVDINGKLESNDPDKRFREEELVKSKKGDAQTGAENTAAPVHGTDVAQPGFSWHSGGTTGGRSDLYAPPTTPTGPGETGKPANSTGTTGEGGSNVVPAAPQKPKIIKSGDLALEVKSFPEASQKVIDLTVRFDGYLADNKVIDLPGGGKRGDITIRVLPERFEGLFSELKKIGKVESERAGAQDVTGAFSDTEARIRNLQISEARLQELVKSKTYLDRVEDLLTVERELEKTRGQIEELQGQLNTWGNLIRYSSIRVVLQEPTTPQPSGSLSVEVGGLSTAKATLDTALTQLNGKLLSGQTNKRGDGTLMGTYEVQVDLAHFGGMLAAIKGLGRVQDEKIQNQPFSNAAPEGSANVLCNFALILYEKSAQLPGGSVTVEVPSVPEALKKLEGIVSGFEGSVLNNQTSHMTTGQTTSIAMAQMQLRVRAGSFAALLEALKSVGKITVQNVNGEVGLIQGGTADVPATLSLMLTEADQGAKEIPEGTLGIVVEPFAGAQEKLQHIVGEFKIDVKQADSRQIGKQKVAAYTLAIHADKIDDAVAALEQLGEVKVRQLKGIGLSQLAHPDPAVIGLVVLSLEEKVAVPRPEPSGTLDIEADNFNDAKSKLAELVKQFGVTVESSNSAQDGDRTVAAFSLTLPAAKVDAAELALEGLGKVKTRNLSGIGLGGLAQFDAEAKAHINLRLAEKPKAVDTSGAPGVFAQSWSDSWNGFQNSLGAILRGFGVILPWLAVLGLVLWLMRRFFFSGGKEQNGVVKSAETPKPPAGV